MAVKAPTIGQMTQIIKFERNEPTQLGAGKKDNYIEWLTTRGSLRQERGFRFLENGEGTLQDRWVLYVRFQAAIEEHISKSIKIVCNNMIFTVNSFELVGEKRRYYRFTLNEKK